jgi:hypothetical protein
MDEVIFPDLLPAMCATRYGLPGASTAIFSSLVQWWEMVDDRRGSVL